MKVVVLDASVVVKLFWEEGDSVVALACVQHCIRERQPLFAPH